MSQLPHDPNDLFRRARAELDPSAADRARNMARVMTAVGAAATTTTLVSTAKAQGSVLSALKLALTSKAAIVGGAILAVGVGVPTAMRVGEHLAEVSTPTSTRTAPLPSPSPSPSPSPLPSTPTPTPTAALPPLARPAAMATSKSTSTPTRARGLPLTPPQGADLMPELQLMERLHAAEARGDATAVLALAAEHERAFPRGALIEEREAARTVALCTQSRSRATADAFVARFPRSPQRARVEAACAE